MHSTLGRNISFCCVRYKVATDDFLLTITADIYRVWLKIDAVRGKPQFDSYESFFAKFCSNRFTFVEIVPDNPNLGSRTILTRDTDIGILFVRLSVHNAPVLDENGLTYRHSFFSPYGSPIILVLPASNIFTKFRRGHPLQRR